MFALGDPEVFKEFQLSLREPTTMGGSGDSRGGRRDERLTEKHVKSYGGGDDWTGNQIKLKPRKMETRPPRPSCSSYPESSWAKRERRAQAAKDLLFGQVPSFQEFVKAKEVQVLETEFHRQGRLLASVLNEKFDSKISGVVPGDSSFTLPPPKAAVVPLLSTQALQPAAGSSPTQLEQVRTLRTDLVPAAEPGTRVVA